MLPAILNYFSIHSQFCMRGQVDLMGIGLHGSSVLNQLLGHNVFERSDGMSDLLICEVVLS